ncbi:protein NATD1-like [Lampris incognitus]|uniref:protein NATD1-like n=1 Tax=Lampris incognitus TaxID=2546036 RepID=UPI0024B4DAC3|nr:protein NATD1-like [Lampris incognitus]
MAFKLFSSVNTLASTRRLRAYRPVFRASNGNRAFTVEHDRQTHDFTVRLRSEEGNSERVARLRYAFTGEKEVDLLATYVPESFRGKGVAALLAKAAMTFVVEENLKAHISCWYIKKYIEDNPLHGYEDRIIN